MNESEVRRWDIDESKLSHKHHIKSLVDFLLSEVGSAGGDGDAIWIVKHYTLISIRKFVLDFCLTDADKRYWRVGEITTDEHGERFSLANNQESLVFTTTDKHVPSWSQCTITV